jgi:DNA-dependent RNA polymerase auxiliary subunit epsilon
LKILLDRNLRFEPCENNLKTLGDIYIEELQKSDQAKNNVDDGSEEKEKIESFSQRIYEICTATRIKKLVKTAQYSIQFIEEVEMNTLAKTKDDSEAVPDKTQYNLSQFDNMTAIDKMKHLCDKFGEERKFDFMSNTIPKRYQPFASSLKCELESFQEKYDTFNVNPVSASTSR